METTNGMLTSFLSNLLAPVLSLVSVYAVYIVKHFLNKITESIIGKNNADELAKNAEVQNQLLEVLNSTVEAAVATNMQAADFIKKSKGELSSVEGSQLKDKAIQMVFNSLPDSFKDSNSKIVKILGGTSQVNSIISNLIEKHVYEYKD